MEPTNPNNDVSLCMYFPQPVQIVDKQTSGKLAKTKPAAESEEKF